MRQPRTPAEAARKLGRTFWTESAYTPGDSVWLDDLIRTIGDELPADLPEGSRALILSVARARYGA